MIKNVNVDKSQYQVITYIKIRLFIGLIGLLIPFVLWMVNTLLSSINIFNNTNWIKFKGIHEPQTNLKYSISHFYYSTVGEISTAALCAVALFLFCYGGYPKPSYDKYHFIPRDSFMTNVVALLASFVVVFPTSSEEIKDNLCLYINSVNAASIHYSDASQFFLSLTTFSFVNFRRKKDPENFRKMKLHLSYKYCGIVILSSMLILFSIYILDKMKLDVRWTQT